MPHYEGGKKKIMEFLITYSLAYMFSLIYRMYDNDIDNKTKCESELQVSLCGQQPVTEAVYTVLSFH